MKKSLTLKVFAITFLSFLFFVFCISFVQSNFFAEFYQNKKVEKLVEEIDSFAAKYSNSKFDEEELSDAAMEFSAKTASYMRPFYMAGKMDGEAEKKLRDNYEFIEESQSVYSITKNDYSDYTNINITKFIYNEKDDVTIALQVNMSLRSIDEAMKTLEEYNLYFYLIAIALSLLIGGFSSFYITRPIVEIVDTSNKMAKMEPDAYSEIKRKDEIGELSESLNTLYGNLHGALAELKLELSKQQAREEKRREFIANASHELKTPIGAIKGFAECIKDGVRIDKHPYYIDTIIDETDKMNKLIIDMLNLSKIDEGKESLNPSAFSPEELVESLIKPFQTIVSKKGMEIIIEGEFQEMTADRGMMGMALSNLISNAIKYGNDNSEIRISGELEDDGRQKISIMNKCETLDEEELEKIWERFYKVEKSHNRDFGGTGLGLSIVKTIFTIHEYDFGAESLEDGIRFYFKA